MRLAKEADEKPVSTSSLLSSDVLERAVSDIKPLSSSNSLAHRSEYDSNEDIQKLIMAIRTRARIDVLEEKKSVLSNDEDFFALENMFSQWGSQTMTYDEFKQQATLAPASIKRFFSSATFLSFPRNESDAIGCEAFLRFASRHRILI